MTAGILRQNADVYICPAGQTLSPNHEGKLRDLRKSITAA